MNQKNQHTGLISRLNAWMLHKSSENYNEQVEDRKKSLFADLKGEVLEVGPGTGANLKYYSDEVSLIGLEPSPYMQQYLKEKSRQLGKSVEVITGVAEDIPLGDERVETVVATLVLCTVDEPPRVLQEIKRVLKPGGRFLFIEHVAAPEKSWLRTIQKWVKPAWKCLADGCHPDRETWKIIEDAGFEEVTIEHFRLSLPVVGTQIIGTAVKK